MKRIMIAAVCIVALTACKQKENNAAELAFQQQRDSLTHDGYDERYPRGIPCHQ